MKMEQYVAPLIRASLDNDLKTIRAIAVKIIRNIKKTDPEIAEQISEALNFHGAGLPSSRSIGYDSLPQDNDSRYDLLMVQEPLEIDPPIFSEKLYKVINTIIDERNNINRLISASLKPTSSILLYGAPGVGKTMLARYLAGVFKMKFASLDLATSVSSYLGKTGQNLKKVLDYAKREPTLLLLDEFDAIAKKRDDSSDLGELKRVVNVLLKELEDWPSQSIIIGATNHPDLLDRAIWRRFDIVLEIPLPDCETRRKTIEYYFQDTEYTSSIMKLSHIMAELTDGMSPSDIEKACERAKKQSFMYGIKIEKALITETAVINDNKDIEFNKKFCRLAKEELNMSYRDMAGILGKSVSAVQNYLKRGVNNG